MWKLKTSEGKEANLTSVNNHVGRQFWEYDPTEELPEELAIQLEEARDAFRKNRFKTKHSSDIPMRLQLANQNPCELIPKVEVNPEEKISEETVTNTLRRGLRYYSSLQVDDGHWPGDYGGPMFLLPGLIIGLYVTRTLNAVIPIEHRYEMRRYLFNHQNEDGGWGLHIEGGSTMFGTALSYVTLRLMGDELNGGDCDLERARKWILDHGGVTFIPSWGKFWLSVLGIYEWKGNNPLPPELWLLPYLLPMHPGRMWCHTRLVYLPMSYLYGRRFVAPLNPTLLSLRRELYPCSYHKVNWDKARNLCAKEDLYYPHPMIQDILWSGLHEFWEPLLKKWPFSLLRQKALSLVMEHIHHEDASTNYICIGPVNKVLNMLCCWVEDPSSMAFQRHIPRVKDYLWLAEDGMKMQGYNGSQLWDVLFAVQAILATNLTDEYGSMLKKAHDFIGNTQVRKESSSNPSSWYRHISKGGWPFSTPDNGWIASDCTGEGLKCALLLSKQPYEFVGEALRDYQLFDAVNLLLSLQNPNGGFASYELTRSYTWLEMINPAETFGDIAIDYQYVECTSTAIQGLASFIKMYPGHRRNEIMECITNAIDFIESVQLPDGSWYGSWGVCFTYGTWLGVKGLIAAGKTYENSSSIQRACNFLLSKQVPSGGWGESYLSCQNKVYTNLEGNRSHIVNTAWAMLALMEARQEQRDATPLHKAARVLINSQMENGDFPQEEIMGVFNRNCMISYSAYRNIFPIWALGEYYNRVLVHLKSRCEMS